MSTDYYRDGLKFVGFMCLMAAFGFAASVYRFIQIGTSPRIMAIRGLDIITTVIPPALPVAISVGTSFALQRLKQEGISCIAPSKVAVAGLIECFAFDKTGTLTEDGLVVHGALVPVTSSDTMELHVDIGRAPLDTVEVLAACHSLADVGGAAVGDPLEAIIVQATRWTLERSAYRTCVSPPPDGNVDDSLLILRRFNFVSALRRMSVVVRVGSRNSRHVLTKGAPETVLSLCDPKSVPPSAPTFLERYVRKGYRVLACARRDVTAETDFEGGVDALARKVAESGLTFVGFVALENALKPSTAGVINDLLDAHVRTLMATGDNPRTAVWVARQCGILSSSRRVFLADVEEDGVIWWRDVDNPDSTLDARTLLPSQPLVAPLVTPSTPIAPTHDFLVGEGDAPESEKVGLLAASGSLQEVGYGVPCSDSDNDVSTVHFGEWDEVNPECPLPYDLALTGQAFQTIRDGDAETACMDVSDAGDKDKSPSLFEKVLVAASVFARMSPDEKTGLIKALADVGYSVGMCGDGANDCGALKAAHAGVSLSMAEASVAAPFTSSRPNISCTRDLLREGRCAVRSTCTAASLLLVATDSVPICPFSFHCAGLH
jgi:cation-transporting P-type ATPase 13A2